MLEEATLIACLFSICCRCKRLSFHVSNVVFVLAWSTCLVSIIGVPSLSHSGASVIVW